MVRRGSKTSCITLEAKEDTQIADDGGGDGGGAQDMSVSVWPEDETQGKQNLRTRG